MRCFSKEGDVLMEITAIERREENMVVRGKMLGTMPVTIYIKPEELREAFKLLNWRTWLFLPVFMTKAFTGSWTAKLFKKKTD